MISIDKPEVVKRLRALGVFWTEEEGKANVYWGKEKPYRAIFKAEVSPDQVDWDKTKQMRLSGRFAGESEIRLKDNQMIKVIHAETFKPLSHADIWSDNKEELLDTEVFELNKLISTGRTVNESEGIDNKEKNKLLEPSMEISEKDSGGSDMFGLFEMANVKPKYTGLGFYIWVSHSYAKHIPRIKVMNDASSWSEDNFAVSISDNPKIISGKSKRTAKELEMIFLFVKKNKDILLKYWKKELDTDDLFSALDPVKIEEASWASEVGALRSELSEIQSIYGDFGAIESRIDKAVLDDKYRKSIIRMLQKAEAMVSAADIEFREITKSPKAPSRTPITMTKQNPDRDKELRSISLDLSMLSVKIRNIGQATDEFENVKVSDVAETFEAASEIVRRAFVKFSKYAEI